MFTGIIEGLGEVVRTEREGSNQHIWLKAEFTSELQIDQSVAHNGVCLTVVEFKDEAYCVTAIDETLKRTNLGALGKGDLVNLERCLSANGRFDGHIVQGHVDQTATVNRIEEKDGSWNFYFQFEPNDAAIVVEKGSITINGVSLTVVEAGEDHLSVSIIPYTYEHTNFKDLTVGSTVNLEFDVLGKYVMEAHRRMVSKA